jgi:hypothetical protein
MDDLLKAQLVCAFRSVQAAAEKALIVAAEAALRELVASLASGRERPQWGPSRHELESVYLRPVASVLDQIREIPTAEQDRFLILWPEGRSELYVQCYFFDGDRSVRCEAASGFYWAALEGFFTPAKRDLLSRLGFSTDDTKGNFVQERRVRSSDEIAELLIETLASVLDVDAASVLMFHAPVVSSVRGRLLVGPEPHRR